MAARVVAIRQEVSDWAERFKIDTLGVFRAWSGGESAARDPSPSTTSGVGAKDVTVWKLPEQVTKQEFRHWLDTIDTNLDAVHCYHFPEVVLDKVKRYEVEVNSEN